MIYKLNLFDSLCRSYFVLWLRHWFGRFPRKNLLPAFKHSVANNQALTPSQLGIAI